MNGITKEIFENYQVRKTKKQKEAFRAFLTDVATREGYECHTEDAGKKAKNVIVGSPKDAKVVYTAHYDTCAAFILPNFITPKCFPIYLLYQLFLSLVVYIIPFIMIAFLPALIVEKTGSDALGGVMFFLGYVALVLAAYLMVAGPANKHTANDNTSGVTLLIDLMRAVPEEKRDEVAFIFFDLEEMGLIGSQYYKKKHKKEMEKKLLINFDCVSDGKNILFVVNKKAREYEAALRAAFPSTDTISVDVALKGVFYPSDQKSFNMGIGVAALKKTKWGLLYMDKIHTPRDTAYDEENIAYLVEGAVRLVDII